MSQLINILQKLSKSSPNAVYTPKSIFTDESENIFDYLYIQTPIEKKYKILLEENKQSKSIIFLSGSSGDGKSAIIGKNEDDYKDYYDIHIDATHSFRPDQSAIQTLDEVFNKFKNSKKSLVVGINMGILSNYSREGSDVHIDIKDAITLYLDNQGHSDTIIILNFEDYPKFEMSDNSISSPFIHSLLNKITEQTNLNPFYTAFDTDLKNDIHTIEHQNFKLLSMEAIQTSIVELLVTVHLKYDQFLTTRGIIDFIYTILKGPNLLINQLFDDESNSIIQNIKKEDPILFRTKLLDTFILERSSNKSDDALDAFINEFNSICKRPILNGKDSETLIRTFFLFRDSECSTNHHQRFAKDYDDEATLKFIQLVSASNNDVSGKKVILKNFHKEIRNAIFAYTNKHAPQLTDKSLFTFAYLNGFHISTHAKILQDTEALKNISSKAINHFQYAIKVNDISIEPITVSLSMYKMILTINDGYRPNKHDRNSIIIFEELLEKISDKVKISDELVFMKDHKEITFTNNIDEIEVAEHVN